MIFNWFPEQASTIASQVDLLLVVLTALGGFFTSIVMVLLIYFGIRYRRGTRVDRSDPPTTSLRVEIAWVLGLLFLGMGTYTWATILYFNMMRPPANAMEVYALGLQWMWQFQHPQGQREINELHVPVGTPVRVIMISQDVIHSLYIPAFRLKFDVLPNRYTDLWFEATQTGEYHLFCAEFCGTLHAGMIGRVIVMEQSEYQDWLAGAGAGAPIRESGEQLFTQLGCSSCHAPESNVQAPPLEGLFGQEVLLEDGRTVIADETYLRESILYPMRKIVAGYEPIMPSYEGRISETQLMELVSYIKSLSNPDSMPQGNLAEPKTAAQEGTEP
jgi:cytochrome c oxidase subunit II